MKWEKGRDGSYSLPVDPDSTITNGFRFVLGKDASCVDITISSFTTSTQGQITVVSSSQSGNTIFLQTTGFGDILIELTLSNSDVRRAVRRYTESKKSTIF